MSADPTRSPAAKVMDEAIDLAIEGSSSLGGDHPLNLAF
jgi:hypothetical protein